MFVFVPSARESFLDRAPSRSVAVEGVPITAVGPFACLALARRWAKDEANFAEIVKGGADVQEATRYLRRYAPWLLRECRRLVARARSEPNREREAAGAADRPSSPKRFKNPIAIEK
ncbi:hypothetical protein AMOR_18470 [Anaeromyxobacter oryzae]|uniref:DUF433 domain-containing protein n=1 Tax=Anaeromyxobacter oryzae TaxID=2918170 RepID=A0ABM7WTP1_9BACT|nr:hypothetical protein AMOR_18470 [Anaeromyxobacter oryzae]